MSADLCLIVPELGAGVGGVADYTLRLVNGWPLLNNLRYLVPRKAGASIDCASPYPVEEFDCNADAFRKCLSAEDGTVFLQYSAYGFDRFGFPRWLLQTLRAWKRERSGRRLVIMFHEIWTFWPWWNRNWILQQLHRREIGRLLAAADAVFTTTASQAAHLRSLRPRSQIEVLAVGSNFRPSASSSNERQTGQAVLFGLQGGRLRALRSMSKALRTLVEAGHLRKIVTVGGGNQRTADEEERSLLSSLRLPLGFEQLGATSEAEISAQLSAATFGISSQDELSLTKSGTFMAYAAHGLSILSPAANPAAGEPLSCLVSPAELLRGISGEELAQRARRLHDWQERTASWPHIAERFAASLQLGTVSSDP